MTWRLTWTEGCRGAFRRRAVWLALGLAAAPGGAFAQTEPAEPAAEAEADDPSFGRVIGRIFTEPLDLGVEWPDPDKDPSAVCASPASAEAVEDAVIAQFGSSVTAAWERPTAPDPAAEQAIVLEICLGPEGEALGRPRLIRPVGPLEPSQSDALLAALAAIEAVAPYQGEPEAYSPWRRVTVLFDPSYGAEPLAPDPAAIPEGAAPNDQGAVAPADEVEAADSTPPAPAD